jgi:hypothetical protein
LVVDDEDRLRIARGLLVLLRVLLQAAIVHAAAASGSGRTPSRAPADSAPLPDAAVPAVTTAGAAVDSVETA